MDVTMCNQMEMTMAKMDRSMESNSVQVGNRTTLGGGMDVTMAPTSNRVEPASSLSKTLVGGGMDITLDPTTGDYTRHGGGMETTLMSNQADHLPHGCGMETTTSNQTDHLPDSLPNSNGMETTVVSRGGMETDHLPDSLPNSNNSSFDGGATATVKFSQLALANNTLVLPR